jgi:hypothetical protein
MMSISGMMTIRERRLGMGEGIFMMLKIGHGRQVADRNGLAARSPQTNGGNFL